MPRPERSPDLIREIAKLRQQVAALERRTSTEAHRVVLKGGGLPVPFTVAATSGTINTTFPNTVDVSYLTPHHAFTLGPIPERAATITIYFALRPDDAGITIQCGTDTAMTATVQRLDKNPAYAGWTFDTAIMYRATLVPTSGTRPARWGNSYYTPSGLPDNRTYIAPLYFQVSGAANYPLTLLAAHAGLPREIIV